MKRFPTLATPNYILLLAAALLPRLMALGRYVTPDELAWVERSIGLRRALLTGDWAATIQTGHPGVTTSWLGAIGIQVQLWLQPAGQASLNWLETLYWFSPDNQLALRQLSLFLSSGRLLVILTTSLGILLIYRLSRPLLGDGAALIGGLLLALDPFTAGLSGLLHLDALLATFALLAVLALLPGQPARPRYGLFAGVLTGLALLTKTPALLLLLFIPGLLFWRWQIAPRLGAPGQIDGRELGRLLLSWLAGLTVTLFLLLPALWAAPTTVYEQVAGLSGRLLETAVRPIFYLGELTDKPGPSYYPVVVFLRLTPVTTAGLLLLAGAAWTARRERRLTGQAQTLLLLLAYSLAFLLMLSLAAKKYDRYALPAILPLLLLAASGWVWLGARWPRFRGLPDGFAALVAAGQFLFLLVVLPFPLAAYNWLGGGLRVAERVMTVGWGEAVSTAAADLGQGLPAGVSLPTLFTDNVVAAAPFYPGPVARLTANNLRFARAGDSIVVEAASWQGGLPELLASREADQYWQLRGLTARRYPIAAVTPLPRQLVGWSFGAVASVTQVEFDGAAWPERIPLALAISLDQPANYQLQLALQDSNGHVWASWEQPLLNEFDQTGTFWIADIPYRRRYDLAFPGDIPPGSYTLTASLFADGARLGVFDGVGQFAGVSLPLATLPISAPIAAFNPEIPQPVSDGAFLGLAGFGTLPAVLDNGGSLSLDVWWTAGEPAGQLDLIVGDTTVTTTFTPPTIPAGAAYHLRPRWELPLELASGEQPLALQFLDETGSPLWAEPYPLGPVEVRQRPRTFDLPAGLDPLNLQFGDLALLQSATAQLEGDKVIVELVWQARGPLDRDYFHFVHLRGSDGQIVSQSDRAPAEPTSLWVTGQVIVDRVALDRPVAGDYTIAIGLYDPETGQRPPLFDSRGAPLSADQTDQYLLPLTVP